MPANHQHRSRLCPIAHHRLPRGYPTGEVLIEEGGSARTVTVDVIARWDVDNNGLVAW
jgi:hypothetical protein